MQISQKFSTCLIVPKAIDLAMIPEEAVLKTVEKCYMESLMQCGLRSVHARNAMDILTLCARKGATITLTVEGPDADEAIRALEDLFVSSLGSEESVAGTEHGKTDGQKAGVDLQ